MNDPFYADYENSEFDTFDSSAYEFIAKIGRGRYSEVFKAIDLLSNKLVAVKLLKPVKRSKIRRELKILQLVQDSPDAVKLLEVVVDDGVNGPAFIFEFIENQDFRDVYKNLTKNDIQKYMF